MATEFDDDIHYGLFLTGTTIDSTTAKAVRHSELTLAALRAAGILDNMEDGTTPPATDKLWLDKNFDPAVLKEWDSLGSAWTEVTFNRMFGRVPITSLTVTGGTGNAIVVDDPGNLQSGRLYTVTPQDDNDSAVTITITGVGTYNVRYPDNTVIAAHEFTTGRYVLMLFENGRFNLLVGYAAQAGYEAFLSATNPLLAVKLNTLALNATLEYTLLSAVPASYGHLYLDVYVGGSVQPKDGLSYTITNGGTKILFSEQPPVGTTLYAEGAATFSYAPSVANLASGISNDSGVTGASVANALDTLDGDIGGIDTRLTTAEANIQTVTGQISMKTLFDYGGVGDGVTNNNVAAAAMAADLGFICVPYGTFLISSQTISVPVHFLVGGSFTVVAGQEVIFRNRITSVKQHIFKGEGSYRSDIYNEIGEDSKVVHASWFGIFPVGSTDLSTVQTALFNKALQWFTYETREGVFELDNGSYRLDGKVTGPRGVHLKGQGTRRTIFDVVGEGYTLFEAGGDAVRISGIQIEQQAGHESQRTGTIIDFLSYNSCEAEDVLVWGTDIGIKFAGNDCQVRHVMGRYNYGGPPSSGSAVVWQVGGQNARIEDIGVRGQTYTPEHIVLIGDGGSGTIIGTAVRDIFCGEASIAVRVRASGSQSIRIVSIDNVKTVNADSDVAAVVDIQNSGSGEIKRVIASAIQADNGATNLLRVGQTGSGTTSQISLVSGDVESSAYHVADLTRASGTLSHVVIGSAVNGAICTTGVVQSGTMTGIVKPAHIS
jgi:hypothetical protein